MTQEDASGRNGKAGSRADAVLTAHQLWSSGETGDAAHEAAATRFGMTSAEFQAIRDFHQKIVSRAKDEPLVFCRGVSCRLHGADDLHAALKPLLASAGILAPAVDVLCLSQCENGPNFKLGEQVLCTGRGCVIKDDRPWRPVTAGPRPLASRDLII